jgi:hypothetical protein
MTDTAKRPGWALEEVAIDVNKPLRLSADAMRAMHKASGRTLTDILQDPDDDATRWQATAFGELYRRADRSGHMPDAATLWEWSGRADLAFSVDTEVLQIADPTGRESSATSPRSATTGA